MKYLQNYRTFEKKKVKLKRLTEEEYRKETEKFDKNLLDDTYPNQPVTGIKMDS